LVAGLREEEETDLFVIAREEVGFDEILLRKQRPPGEEVRRAPFRWPISGRR